MIIDSETQPVIFNLGSVLSSKSFLPGDKDNILLNSKLSLDKQFLLIY